VRELLELGEIIVMLVAVVIGCLALVVCPIVYIYSSIRLARYKKEGNQTGEW